MPIHAQQLSQETSKLIGSQVLEVGLVDASWSQNQKNKAAVAVAAATYVSTKLVKKRLGPLAWIAGTLGGKQVEEYLQKRTLQNKGLTPIMVCAITKTKIYLLEWDGNHRTGTLGKILKEFDRDEVDINVKAKRKGQAEFQQGSQGARIECNLKMASSNKKMNKRLLKVLQENTNRQSIPVH